MIVNMPHRYSVLRSTASLALLLCTLGLLAGGETRVAPVAATHEGSDAKQSAAKSGTATPRPYKTETVRGKVVWLDEALKRLYGVTTESDAAETVVVLETPDGHLWPIIPDTRGCAFVVDSRLRNIDVQLLARRYEGVPMLQLIRVFRRKPEGLYEIDYWCDTCAISMFILKACECCQGPTRLREQLIEIEPGGVAP
jgi:hypothetical protein